MINREPINHLQFDIELLGYCDNITRHLAKLLGWQIPGQEGIADPEPSTAQKAVVTAESDPDVEKEEVEVIVENADRFVILLIFIL